MMAFMAYGPWQEMISQGEVERPVKYSPGDLVQVLDPGVIERVDEFYPEREEYLLDSFRLVTAEEIVYPPEVGSIVLGWELDRLPPGCVVRSLDEDGGLYVTNRRMGGTCSLIGIDPTLGNHKFVNTLGEYEIRYLHYYR